MSLIIEETNARKEAEINSADMDFDGTVGAASEQEENDEDIRTIQLTNDYVSCMERKIFAWATEKILYRRTIYRIRCKKNSCGNNIDGSYFWGRIQFFSAKNATFYGKQIIRRKLQHVRLIYIRFITDA